MDTKTKNKMPMTIIAISAKKPAPNKGFDTGMEHLKYLHDQMAEATDEDEIKSLKGEIKEWSSVMMERQKAKSGAKGEEEMAEGEGEEDMAEGEEEYPKKKKKKVVSLMDLFNPSRPMGMR